MSYWEKNCGIVEKGIGFISRVENSSAHPRARYRTARIGLVQAAAILTLAICHGEVSAQHSMSYRKAQAQAEGIHYFRDEISIDDNTSKDRRYIVRLKGGPRIGKDNARAQTDFIPAQHAEFKRKFAELKAPSATGRSVSQAEILFEYNDVYNGFAVRANESTLNALKRFDEVESVFEDQAVYLTDLASSRMIKADLAWDETGATGKNVSIGIIDTGIDYTHADLGGGFGATFKVQGGYDFVNSDSDPYDDHGHGTHVAGIAAGKGPGLTGVAPDAVLYAFKALNAEGIGYDSWILAAIEMAMDPDGDPSTDDMLDVVNMSLGRALNGVDPLSEAVNNAVEQGIAFVVSAGNNYDYGTIGTPAIAEHAITVGATDFEDKIASFSSKGPTENSFKIKPDVAAPGVGIYSSVPGNAYASFSGTSMASPHVAGAVALLLEKHPDWTPRMLKSALMHTAENPANELIWHIGAGRINARRALDSWCLVYPGAISFGVSSADTDVVARKHSITITNPGAGERSFSLSAEGEKIDSGLAITFDRSGFKIQPRGSMTVQVTLTVTTSQVPSKSYPQPYTGNIVVKSQGAVIKVPYAFIQSAPTTLEFTGQLPIRVWAVRVSAPHFQKSYNPTGSLSVILPDGTYDFIAMYPGNRYVFKQDVPSGNSSVQFDVSEAGNMLVFAPSASTGALLPIDSTAVGATIIRSLNRNFYLYYRHPVDTFYVSDENGYSFDVRYFGRNITTPEEFYDIEMSSGFGLFGNKTVSNTTDNLAAIAIENPSATDGEPSLLTYWIRGEYGITAWNTTPLEVNDPITIRSTKQKSSSTFMGAIARFAPPPEKAGYSWETPMFTVSDDNSISFSDLAGNEIMSETLSGQFFWPLGSTLPFLNARTMNTPEKIVLTDVYRTGVFNRYFGERENGTVFYKVSKGDVVTASGSFQNRFFDTFRAQSIEIEAAPDLYSLLLEYGDYRLHDVFGTVRAKLDFDTRLSDKNPPILSAFFLETEGKNTISIASGKPGTVKFTVKNCGSRGCRDLSSSTPKVTLELKSSGSQEWKKIPVSATGQGNYVAAIPDTLPDGHFDLRLIAVDASNNRLELQLTPAFIVGPFNEIPYKNVQLLSPANGSSTIRCPEFRWTSIQEAESYVLEVSGSPDFSNAKAITSTVPASTSADLLLKNTTYYWRVRANYRNARSAWSQPFSFTTGEEDWQQVTLLAPQTDADANWNCKFEWSDVGAEEYLLEISRHETFVTPSHRIIAAETSATVLLEPGVKYYWRVKPQTDRGWWSESRHMTVEIPVVQALEPEQDAANVSLSPTLRWSELESISGYTVHLSENEDFSNTVTRTGREPFASYEDLRPSHTYYWKVAVSVGSFTSMSKVFSFTTAENRVTLLSPADKSTAQPLSLRFTWTTASAKSYLFEISKDQSFSSLHTSFSVGDTSVTVANLDPGVTYSWRVRPESNESSWSSVHSFVTLVPIVNLISPANKEKDLPLSITFRWQPVNDAVNYTLVLYEENNILNVARQEDVTGTSITIDNLNPGTPYSWRIGANFLSKTVWSDGYTFSTAITTDIFRPKTQTVHAFPNPCNGNTVIGFRIARPGPVMVSIFNSLGREVLRKDLGYHTSDGIFVLNAHEMTSELADGVYTATITTQYSSSSTKIVVQH